MAERLPGEAAAPAGSERRRVPRFVVDQKVWIASPRLPSVTASLINISATGCAVRIETANNGGPRPWPLHRNGGDELTLLRLLEDPVPCWVVAVETELLRLRFQLDAAMRHRIEQMLTGRRA